MSTLAPRPPEWSARAIQRLLETDACPVCGAATLAGSRCATCRADLTAIGAELWQASQTAASALAMRQAVLDRVPREEPAPAAPRPLPSATPPADASSPSPSPSSPPREIVPQRSSATVQSVLAVAGAGLVAVAALVFTFFNADLTDRFVRVAILATIAAGFLVGARALARRGLRFSAEAVGALGLVFLALVIGSTTAGLTPTAAWAASAIGGLLAGCLAVSLGVLVRLRVWLWTGAVTLAAVPLLFGLAAGSTGGASLGAFGSAVVASAGISALPRVAGRFDQRLRSERVTLTVSQVVAVVVSVGSALATPAGSLTTRWVGVALVALGVTLLSAYSARHLAGGLWSVVAGSSAVATVVSAALAAAPPASWLLGVLPAAAALGFVLITALVPLPAAVGRAPLTSGAVVALGLTVVPTGMAGLLTGAGAVFGVTGDAFLLAPEIVLAVTVGLGAVAVGLGAHARLAARGKRSVGAAPPRWSAPAALWFAAFALLVALTSPLVVAGARAGAALAVAIAGSFVLVAAARHRRVGAVLLLPLVVGAHLLVVLAAVLSVRAATDADSVAGMLVAGAGVAGGLLAVGRTVPVPTRFAHAGAAFAFVLLTIGLALGIAGVGALPLLCLLTTIGGAGAIAATFVRAVPARTWWAILAVTFVPFVAGVVQVVFERSGWTALSTAVMFALALTLTVTRRPGLGRLVRAAAAALLVPSLAVVAVCLGAQVLLTSGSPVVLPVIAALVALVLPARPLIRSVVASRAGDRDADAAALAVESSALVTAVIAVGLSLARDSAGLGTTLLVLVILAIGGAAAARWADRGYGWWLAAASVTGALWCCWGLAGVILVEPYLLPPALGAALVGAVITARGGRGRAIYATGLALAIVPVLAMLTATGSPAGGPARGFALVTVAALLALLGAAARAGSRLAALRVSTLALAVVAASGGVAQAVRWGLHLDAAPAGAPLIILCVGMGAAAALPAALAGRFLAPVLANGAGRRWPYVPAVAFVAASAWTAISRDWFTIWAMWALLIALLGGMLAVAARGRTRPVSLPPVWLLFALAFVTAVVAWSPRDLRVEWFSLPLGFFLVAAGALGFGTPPAPGPRRLGDWPRGWRGSWPLLAPGIVVTLSASVAATYTDPQTWRAILVIVLALAAIVVGASRRWAAPFLIGLVVLPVENALAFLVQIGRGIASMPWWITLSVVGAVLLTIAVTYERRSEGDAGIAARLRDLG